MSLIAMRRRKWRERSAERFKCHVPGHLVLCESGVVFEGLLIDLSIGGAMFRPALTYLLSRKSGDVILKIGEIDIAGEIMGTSPRGYGLRFDQALTDAVLRRVLACGDVAVAA